MSDGEPIDGDELQTVLCSVSTDDWDTWAEAVQRWRTCSLKLLAACGVVTGVVGGAVLWVTGSPATVVVYALAAPTVAYYCWRVVARWSLRRFVGSAEKEIPIPDISPSDWAQIVRTGGAIVGPQLIRAETSDDRVSLVATNLDTTAYRRSSLFSWDRLA